MKRSAPALEVAVIPNVGHAPLLSEPESALAVDEFLKRVP
jgi:hypothetical protein